MISITKYRAWRCLAPRRSTPGAGVRYLHYMVYECPGHVRTYKSTLPTHHAFALNTRHFTCPFVVRADITNVTRRAWLRLSHQKRNLMPVNDSVVPPAIIKWFAGSTSHHRIPVYTSNVFKRRAVKCRDQFPLELVRPARHRLAAKKAQVEKKAQMAKKAKEAKEAKEAEKSMQVELKERQKILVRNMNNGRVMSFRVPSRKTERETLKAAEDEVEAQADHNQPRPQAQVEPELHQEPGANEEIHSQGSLAGNEDSDSSETTETSETVNLPLTALHQAFTSSWSPPFSIYLNQFPISQFPIAKGREELPPPFLLDGSRTEILKDVVSFGSEPCHSPLRKNQHHNFMTQLCGRQHVRLVTSSFGERICATVDDRLRDRQHETSKLTQAIELEREMWGDWFKTSPIPVPSPSILRTDIMNFGAIRDLMKFDFLWEAVLDPGDSLFIPEGWWHSHRSSHADGRLNSHANWWFRIISHIMSPSGPSGMSGKSLKYP